jgi:thiamine biosynthesis lipoprotein
MPAADVAAVLPEPRRDATAWSRVSLGSALVAAADRDALGTTARLVVWPPENLPGLLAVVDAELAALDRQASRFREDSEISAAHRAGEAGCLVSDGLAEAVRVALAAAEWTGGRCDPTVGWALIELGYDRDFTLITPGDAAAPPPRPVPGWQAVRLDGNMLRLPAGVRLDLGATAKGLGADRAARAAYAAAGGGGVLVSLGGDMTVAGRPPVGGWPVLVADEHRQIRAARNLAVPPVSGWADPATAQWVRLRQGGLATSSVTCRQWMRADRLLHHIIDPATGLPADGPWRTVSVAAPTCAQANAAATAAIIAGPDALGWLAAHDLPARLVGHDGSVALAAGWPRAEGGIVPIGAGSR